MRSKEPKTPLVVQASSPGFTATPAELTTFEKNPLIIAAVKKIQLDIELVLVAGPKIKEEFGNNLRNLGFVENLHEIIFASDLVISLAGKSTIDESVVYGTPGIFIPIKDHFEQEDNAKEMGFNFEDIFSRNLEACLLYTSDAADE